MLLRTCVLVTGLSLLGSPVAAQTGPVATLRGASDAVSATILATPQLTVFDVVQGSVSDGVVTLTGKVTTPAKRDAVRRSVMSVEGVRDVQDLIVVLPESKSDDELRERIARSIYGHARFWRYAMMSNPPIRIIVDSGGVTLTGVLANQRDRALARALAMQSGARSVIEEFEQ